jgi:phage terminase large subunit-like protein
MRIEDVPITDDDDVEPPSRMRRRTRGERNIKWCQDHLFIPEGQFVGQPLRMAEFMKEDFRAIYDNPAGTRRAIISRGRKNAKTTECAFILLLHLVGPEHKVNSSMYSCAQSRDQASVLFALAAKMIRMSPTLRDAIIVKDGMKELVVPELGTKFKSLSAEVSTAYGLSPVLTIFDELGQCRGPRSPLYEAMETATGAQKDPLTVIISTQAPTDADLLSILIDDALAAHDPRTICRLSAAPKHADPFARSTIAMANPALGFFLNESEVLSMAETARRMPAREAEYRNLVLNERVEASNPFVAPSVWKECGGSADDLTGHPCYAGLDLSEVNDLTAFVIIALINKKWHVKSEFWLPEEGIYERSRNDRVPYDRWAKEGYLNLIPGNSISYNLIAPHIFELCKKYDIRKCAFDRWGFKYLKPWLLEAGFSEQQLEAKFVEFGQGTKMMAPALRDLESCILERQLVHDDHPILSMCMVNAVTEGNDTGKDSSNRKLSKKKSVGRIDGAVALAMAFGTAPLRVEVDISSLIG